MSTQRRLVVHVLEHQTALADLLAHPRYFPRVTQHDTKPMERALAGPTLFDDGARLDGVVVEATYAAGHPAILDHLHQQRVPVIIDPQSLRLVTPRYLDVERLRTLPYALNEPLTPAGPAETRQRFVSEALSFQQQMGATYYLVPSVPLRDDPAWWELHYDLTDRAAECNGTEVDRRDLIALLSPGTGALRDRWAVSDRLQDVPIAAAYVQPLVLEPTSDSVDKLARAWAFYDAVGRTVPVIAGRVGAFGLVLQALGAAAFDSGLGGAERYRWVDPVRPPAQPSDEGQPARSGGAGKRVYVEQLLTTVPASVWADLLRVEAVRGRLVCNRPCCRLASQGALVDRRGEHYLFTRADEVSQLRREPTSSIRFNSIHQKVLAARSLAEVARRGLEDVRGQSPSFHHLETWLGLLSRVQQLRESGNAVA
jgi:hypothetical protein